jgi:DNA/RNA endonuclease YhcR with UshA esterase domain
MLRPFVLIIFLLFNYYDSTYAQDTDCQVTVETVASKLGEYVVFCGKVTQVAQPRGEKGNPVFLNFGGTYPNHKFTVVIWEEVYQASESFLFTLEGKEVTVKGKVVEYKVKPQIEIVFLNDLKLR